MGSFQRFLAAALLVSGVAFAQSSGVDTQLFKPMPGYSDVLGLQGTRPEAPLKWQAGLFVNYASNPLLLVDKNTGQKLGALVSSQTALDFIGAMGLAKNFELGLAVPLSFQTGDAAPKIGFPNAVSSFAMGDVRLIPKYRVMEQNGIGLAISAPLIIPSGSASAFTGGAFGVQPRLAADYALPNDFRFLANVGLTFRPSRKLQNLTVGDDFVWGAGTEIPVKLSGRDLAVLASITGSVQLSGQGQIGAPTEILIAARYRMRPELALTVGAGRGITSGYGTPDFRILGGIVWGERERPVQEEVVPPKPTCAFGPEDFDGFQDDDGCADPDNDGDGILDTADQCPNDPETKNGYLDEDGCPDSPPPPLPVLPKPVAAVDSDGDGLLDPDDRCPTQAEDKDGFEDADGCPEPDNDRDGILDAADKCPLEAETINGVTDEDGCPDKGKSKVVVTAEKIVILDKVYFATDKDVILPKSFGILKQVAAVLKANPQLTHVRVEGHTDDQGDDKHNMDLSQRRANSVAKFLMDQSIDKARLEAVGYGETKPVDTNKTAKGREKNRRVEFTIVQDEPKQDSGTPEPVKETP